MTEQQHKGETIASVSNGEHWGDIHWHSEDLIRLDDGRYMLVESGGARMQGGHRRYIQRDEAVDFIVRRAVDPVTGYGFTAEQAELMADGHDAGKGYRGRPD